jgi:MFS family permease
MTSITSPPASDERSVPGTPSDPTEIIGNGKMSRFQLVAILVLVLLNASDGYDVLAISFASPGIAAEWGIDRAALGVVLSMELIGMAVGSVLIGRLADTYGRRPIILACVVIMALGMILAWSAKDLYQLSAYRFFTGIGIGGMLASANAMVAEYSNKKNRHLAVTIMAAGFPIGAVVGGSIASFLLVHFGWQSVFMLGAIINLALIPLVLFLLPESISYLNKTRPKNALERINATLAKMGHPQCSALAEVKEDNTKQGWQALFSSRWALTTIMLTIAYFAHIMTFYYMLKWIPKIVVDLGLSPRLLARYLSGRMLAALPVH